MAIVYVTQEVPRDPDGAPRLNLTPALQYGNLIFLTPAVIQNYEIQEHLVTLREALNNYDGEKDYLLCLGNPTVQCLAAIAAGEVSPVVTFLMWDRIRKFYYPVKINLEESDDEMATAVL